MATDHELLMQVKERQDQLARQIQDVKELKTAASQQPTSNTGNATITVNMGGWGIAICVAAAVLCVYTSADQKASTNAAMLSAQQNVIDVRAEARELRRKVDRREDYLNMLWQRYPELRPEKLQPEKQTK